MLRCCRHIRGGRDLIRAVRVWRVAVAKIIVMFSYREWLWATWLRQDEIRSFLNPYVRYFFFAYLVLDYFINLRPMHRVTDLVYFCFKMI